MTPKVSKKSFVPTIDLKISFFEDEKSKIKVLSDSEKEESRNLGTEQNTVTFADVANLYYSTATETHSFISASKE